MACDAGESGSAVGAARPAVSVLRSCDDSSIRLGSDLVKNLVIIRHAKSSWDNPAWGDLERPLNERGKRDAPLMGRALREHGVLPDLILSSPAKRARKTAIRIAEAVGYPEDRISVEPAIYLRGLHALVDLIGTLPVSVERAFLIGHNPDLTELVELLTGESIGNLPTCGMVSVEFAVDDWRAAAPANGRMAFFDYPKRHRPAQMP